MATRRDISPVGSPAAGVPRAARRGPAGVRAAPGPVAPGRRAGARRAGGSRDGARRAGGSRDGARRAAVHAVGAGSAPGSAAGDGVLQAAEGLQGEGALPAGFLQLPGQPIPEVHESAQDGEGGAEDPTGDEVVDLFVRLRRVGRSVPAQDDQDHPDRSQDAGGRQQDAIDGQAPAPDPNVGGGIHQRAMPGGHRLGRVRPIAVDVGGLGGCGHMFSWPSGHSGPRSSSTRSRARRHRP